MRLYLSMIQGQRNNCKEYNAEGDCRCTAGYARLMRQELVTFLQK
jgi:hypothetical protein